jgi:hypothetical protein
MLIGMAPAILAGAVDRVRIEITAQLKTLQFRDAGAVMIQVGL